MFDKLLLVLAVGLVQRTDSALTQSTGSELAQPRRELNAIDPSPSPPPIAPPIPPPIPPSLTCPEAKPVGVACAPALEGLTCEYGPAFCACPTSCQPCEAEEKTCVNSNSATCDGVSWWITIREPTTPPCPPPPKAPKPVPPPPFPPPSPPFEPPSPPSQPPFQCPDLTLKTKGWQMISFNCRGTYIA